MKLYNKSLLSTDQRGEKQPTPNYKSGCIELLRASEGLEATSSEAHKRSDWEKLSECSEGRS